MRAALYWTPNLGDPLFAAGNAWLGRDPETGATLPQPDVPGIAALTADARRYGFHATLRAPMRLRAAWPELLDATARIAASQRPFVLPRLQLASVDGFLALTLSAPCPAMDALARACVQGTEAVRAPLNEFELARRRAAPLTARQEELLAAWGYPYVMEEFSFHMTLSDRLNEAQLRALWPVAEAHFAASLAMPRMVEEIAVFTQGNGEFLIAERVELG